MELQVGDKRKFSFKEENYVIKEILDNPNISMNWTWKTGVCPHCKKKIEYSINHKFYKIEILVKDGVTNPIRDDILIMGHTLDNKYMYIPIEEQTYNLALDKSVNFKEFKEIKI